MERWDIYDIKRAIKLYLGTEEKINWETDCIVENDSIVEWNISSKEKPTVLQLEESWLLGKLDYYKTLQKKQLNDEFNHLMRNGYGGCETSVLDENDNPIVIDARRGGDYDDYANFRMSLDLINFTGMEKIIVKDYYNNQHEIDSSKMETIYKELLIHGLTFLQKKWSKIADIENCSTIEEVVAITMNNE